MVRRLAGALWCCAWAALLALVHAPWRRLGGLVDERLRWSERFALCLGVIVGHLAGGLARDAAVPRGRPGHLGRLRLLLPPALAACALALGVLEPLGREMEGLLAFNTLLGYWAGLDAGSAALPLLQGRRIARDDPPRSDAGEPE